jgi:hypothetical protein
VGDDLLIAEIQPMLRTMPKVESFIGGMRGPYGANATWPLARLSLDASEGLTVRLRRGLPRLPGLEPVRYHWADIDHAEKIRGWLPGSPGVRLVGHNGGTVVFWTWHPDAVLRALEHHSVAINARKPPPRIWIRP